jgi:hypothetical protein
MEHTIDQALDCALQLAFPASDPVAIYQPQEACDEIE